MAPGGSSENELLGDPVLDCLISTAVPPIGRARLTDAFDMAAWKVGFDPVWVPSPPRCLRN